MADDPRRHSLRAGFDLAAEDYQRTRPVCPSQLFDDLINLAELEAGDRVIEIGCGTGQATVPLAERGMAVTGVELGAEPAAIARRRLAGFPAAEVVTSAFEDWRPQNAEVDAVVAVNSLHWIDPRLRYARPHELLRPGGAMAEAGCLWARPADADRFWTDVQDDTRQWDLKVTRRHRPIRLVHGTSRPRPGISLPRWRVCAIPSKFSTAPKITSPTWPHSPALTHSEKPEEPNSSAAYGVDLIRLASPS